MIVALFDADGTLYSAQYGRGLMRYALAHGRRAHVAAYFASLVPVSLPVALKLTHSEAFDRAKIARMSWLLRGWSEEQGDGAFRWIVDQYLLPTRREAVLNRLRAHQEAGHRVVIASGTFTPSLKVLGDRLGVHDLVGTGIEVRNGRFTGRPIPPVIKGADKLARIQRLLSDVPDEIDWQASFAYGDSYSDRGFMELTGHPVAVVPEDKLRRLAVERNWEIMDAESPA